MEANIVELVLRYGGYWKDIQRSGRRKYECGRRKTIRVEIDTISLRSFGQLIAGFFPTAKGNLLKLSYMIPDSNPKQFGVIRTNDVFKAVLRDHIQKKKVEMFLVIERKVVNTKAKSVQGGMSNEEVNAQYDFMDENQWGFIAEQVVENQTEDEEHELENNESHCDVRFVEDEHEETIVFEEQYITEGIDIDNEEECIDDLDDCYSDDAYHSVHSTDDESGYSDEEIDSAEDSIYSTNMKDPEIEVGKKFKDIKHLRFCLRQHSAVKNFNYDYEKNEGYRVVVKCVAEGCPWKCRAKRLADGITMEISKLEPKHTCMGVNKCKNFQASANWIAQNLLDYVKSNPDIQPKEIISEVDKKFGMTIRYNRAWRAREKAREILFGNIEESYDLVPTLRHELLSRNPGSHIEFKLNPIDNSFQRFFVCFKASIEGFKTGCRPFIGLDGCHLRGKYLGMLLSATALDGNNGSFPIAFAVVEGEDSQTWFWFMQHLRMAFDGGLDNVSFISDQEKGLYDALSTLLPHAEHRVCMRHFWKSLKKKYPGDFFEQIIWDASRSFTMIEFVNCMKILKSKSEAAFNDIQSRTRYTWARFQFNTNSKNHYVVNNVSESFNSWILEARALPVVDLVDKLRSKLMERMNQRRRQGARWKGKLVPYADRYIKDISRRLGGWSCKLSEDGIAEVDNGIDRMEINLVDRTCGCRKWQLIGLPCIHVAALIGTLRNANWEEFCADCFTVERYRKAYAMSIKTLPSKNQWPPLQKDYIVGPPNTKRPRGRPKKKRIRGVDEIDGKKTSKRVHKCTRCKGWGHHKITCKEPLNTITTNITQENPHPAREDSISSRGRGRARSGGRGRKLNPIRGSMHNYARGRMLGQGGDVAVAREMQPTHFNTENSETSCTQLNTHQAHSSTTNASVVQGQSTSQNWEPITERVQWKF